MQTFLEPVAPHIGITAYPCTRYSKPSLRFAHKNLLLFFSKILTISLTLTPLYFHSSAYYWSIRNHTNESLSLVVACHSLAAAQEIFMLYNCIPFRPGEAELCCVLTLITAVVAHPSAISGLCCFIIPQPYSVMLFHYTCVYTHIYSDLYIIILCASISV